MTADVVPFGKYKGQPAETLLTDQDYCEWLLAQPWFKDKFGATYNLVVNYGGEPQDSPEHNQMQAAFLDDEHCLALTRLVWPSKASVLRASTIVNLEAFPPHHPALVPFVQTDQGQLGIKGRVFEHKGWDVSFKIRSPTTSRWLHHDANVVPPPCTCPPATAEELALEREQEWRRTKAKDRRKEIDDVWVNGKPFRDYFEGLHEDTCLWAGSDFRESLKRLTEYEEGECLGVQTIPAGPVYVELKPDLGDDYPSVLRQVFKYPTDGYGSKTVVIARRAAFEYVTWDQVVEMYAASNVLLLNEAEITRKSRLVG